MLNRIPLVTPIFECYTSAMKNEAPIPSVHDSLRAFKEKRQHPNPADLSQYMEELRQTLLPFDKNLVDIVDTDIYERIISRILFQTNALHEYKEIGITERLLSHDWEAPFEKDKVIWESQVAKQMGVAGRYVGGKIHIAENIPTPGDILASLGAYGSLPSAARVLAHERIHAIQNTYHQPIVVYSVDGHPVNFPTPLGPTELIEAQAHRTINTPSHLLSNAQWIIQMQEWRREGKSYTDIDDAKLPFAVIAVDTMNALGFTVSEVAALTVSPGDWDKTSLSYPKIHEAIRKRRQEAGIPSATGIQLLKNNDKLERTIDRLAIMHIVREEINQAATRRGPLVVFSSSNHPASNA